MKEVRVRFAPSPTGLPHIGFARTVLFNWLFARQNNGKMILRLEDTDKKRCRPEVVPLFIEMLDWLGMRPDEGPIVGGSYGPYSQSERLETYQKTAKKLIEKGVAYYCFCSEERLEKMRQEQQAAGKISKYDRHCLQLSKTEVQKKLDSGEPYVIRLEMPDTGYAKWQDIIRGEVVIPYAESDDQVLLKSDGYPTYHLGVVVDDYLMKISHAFRGTEWISSTPKHLYLYECLGWEPPIYGHFPVVLGQDKKKLSKRHGAKNILEYKAEGYLPEAILNTILFWGWAPKDNQEFFTQKEMIKKFCIKEVNKADPIADLTKLDFFNSHYLRQKTAGELEKLLEDFYGKENLPIKMSQIVLLIKDRLGKLSDFKPLTEFLEKLPEYPREWLVPERTTEKRVEEILDKTIASLSHSPRFAVEAGCHTAEEFEQIGRKMAAEMGLKAGVVFMILRVAICGSKFTPPLWPVIEILGLEESLTRLRGAKKKLD